MSGKGLQIGIEAKIKYSPILDVLGDKYESIRRRRRKSSLLYALEQQQPITVQVFRRKHKSDQWYIHLTTYVQEIPVTTSFNNGCIRHLQKTESRP